MDDLADWLRLTSTPGLGPTTQRALLSAFGLPERVFAAGHSAVAGVVGREAALLLDTPLDGGRLDNTVAWLESPGNHIVTLADPAYPPSLLEIADPPALLYVTGNPAVLSAPALAIVGARSATRQGEETARAFSRALAEAGLTIVSGLAMGIDAAAHEGALSATPGLTVAVTGTGADRVYPARHRKLAHAIAEHGAILSEYPLGTAPLPHNFPRRNRLIAGLSMGVLVIEAALNSGSLITARLAAEGGREVFAIPGSIHSPTARGCHRLIRDGAKLVETAADVLDELRWSRSRQERIAPAADQHTLPVHADDEPRTAAVLVALGFDPVDVDTLATRSGLTVDALYAILTPLELAGRISRMPGGRFQRT